MVQKNIRSSFISPACSCLGCCPTSIKQFRRDNVTTHQGFHSKSISGVLLACKLFISCLLDHFFSEKRDGLLRTQTDAPVTHRTLIFSMCTSIRNRYVLHRTLSCTKSATDTRIVDLQILAVVFRLSVKPEPLAEQSRHMCEDA